MLRALFQFMIIPSTVSPIIAVMRVIDDERTNRGLSRPLALGGVARGPVS
jgi:hypothetical protein